MKKVLSFILALSMVMMTMVFATVGVSAASALPITDDFSGAEFDAAKWNASSAAEYVQLVDGAIRLPGNQNGQRGFGVEVDETITSGEISIKFDLNIPADAAGEIAVMGGTTTMTDGNNIIRGYANDGRILLHGNEVAKLTKGQWYTIELVYDAATNTDVTITITNGDELIVTKKLADCSNFKTLGFTQSKFFCFGAKGSTDAGFLFDNVEITKVEKEPKVLPITDDFSGDVFDAEKWDVTNTEFVTQADGVITLLGGEYVQKGIGASVDEAITEGLISFKFDMNVPTDAAGEMAVMGGTTAMNDDHNLIRGDSNGVIKLRGNNIATLEKDAWYTIELLYDAATQTDCTITITKDGEVVATKALADCSGVKTWNFTTSKVFCIGAKYSTNAGYLIDNIAITKVEKAPIALPISDDFEGAELDTAKWNVTDTAFVTQADGVITLLAGEHSQKGIGVMLDEAVTDGLISFTFDMNIPTGTTGEMAVMGGTSAMTDDHNLIRGYSDGKIKLRGNDIATLAKDTWYTINLTYDSATQTDCKITITEQGNPKAVVATKRLADCGGVKTWNFTTSKVFCIGAKGSTNAGYLIDNIAIEKTEKLPKVLPISDDFNSDVFDEEKWNLSTMDYVTHADGVIELSGNTTSGVQKGIGTSLDEAITAGKISFKFDMSIPTGTAGEMAVMGGTSALNDGDNFVRGYSDGKIKLRGNDIATLAKDTWYTIELVYNCSDLTDCEITITEQGNSSAVVATKKLSECAYNTTLPDVFATSKAFGIGAKYSTTGVGFLIDNVTIDRYYEAPKVSEIKFVKYDDTTSTSLTNVSAGTKEIKVVFNTAMLDSSLSYTSVKLVKEGTSTPIVYTGVYSDDDLTWTIPLDNYLDAGAIYKLTLTSGVQNKVGTSAVESFKEFVADAGEYKVTVSAVKGTTPVTALSQLATGNVVTLKADVINTTGKPQELVLIYAGYNGKALKYYKGAEKAITAAQKNISITDVTVTIDKTDLTNFAVYGWESYDSLRVIADSYPVQ